jgi:NitT/TauT family transport system ATP-binding protein
MITPSKRSTPLLVKAGFMPLIDAAPLIAAEVLGFAADEGLNLRLERETSWATVRDRMAVGHLDAAHMLAPMPIAANLGLSPLPVRLIAPMALGCGGNTITVSQTLWNELNDDGGLVDFDSIRAAKAFARIVRERQSRGRPKLVVAVVHLHSAHFYLMAYWLAAVGLNPDTDIDIVVVPPPLTAAALAGGQIDAFCAGEPWGSIAVETASARILTTNAHIWRSSPEKVLGLRLQWVLAHPEGVASLIRSVYRAAVWCDEPSNIRDLARMLSMPERLGASAETIEVSLQRQLPHASGVRLDVDGFLNFAGHAASFPWCSHAMWFYTQMVRNKQTKWSPEALEIARETYRPDVFRAAVASLEVDLPIADTKVEGRLARPSQVNSSGGKLLLGPDTFFDQREFDPEKAVEYLARPAALR